MADDGPDIGGAAPDLRRAVEALLFASGEPLSLERLRLALALPEEAGPEPLLTVLTDLQREYGPGGHHGFELVPLAGGWAFRTAPSCQEFVARLFELPEDPARLSPAAMECLAIIAYLQPVSRPQIAEVRGVNSDSAVHTLVERGLVTEVGRAAGPGGAVLYGTTPRFEAMFGLAGLEDLPPLEAFALTEDQKEDIRRRLGLLTLPE